jgi:hypothetical protein
MREQVALLSHQTKDVIRGEVNTEQTVDRIEHEMMVLASVIGIRVPVLRVSSAIGKSYPATVSGRYVGNSVTCRNEKEFIKKLEAVLGSDEMTEMIRQLYADSRASGLKYFLVEDGVVVGETGSFEAAKQLAFRMMGQDGWIDIHEVEKGRLGYYIWPDSSEEPIYNSVNGSERDDD